MFDRFRILVVLGLLPVLLVGCSSRTFWTTAAIGGAAAAGAATVYYVKSDVEKDIPYDLKRTYQGALESLEQYQYVIQENTLNAIEGKIVAKMPGKDGKTIPLTINLKKNENNGTHVSVRAGVVGDEALASEILENIERAI